MQPTAYHASSISGALKPASVRYQSNRRSNSSVSTVIADPFLDDGHCFARRDLVATRFIHLEPAHPPLLFQRADVHVGIVVDERIRLLWVSTLYTTDLLRDEARIFLRKGQMQTVEPRDVHRLVSQRREQHARVLFGERLGLLAVLVVVHATDLH